jgi:hypothetical protein
MEQIKIEMLYGKKTELARDRGVHLKTATTALNFTSKTPLANKLRFDAVVKHGGKITGCREGGAIPVHRSSGVGISESCIIIGISVCFPHYIRINRHLK